MPTVEGEKLSPQIKSVVAEAQKQIIEAEQEGQRPPVLGKGSPEQIATEFADPECPVSSFELYLTEDHVRTLDPENLPPLLPKLREKKKVKGGHALLFVDWEGQPRHADLSDDGEFGDECEKRVESVINLTAALGGEYVVVHIGVIDPHEEMTVSPKTSENEINQAYLDQACQKLEVAAQRVIRLHQYAQERNLIFVVENDPAWVQPEPAKPNILTNPKLFGTFLNQIPEDVRVIFDNEHLYRAAVFERFLPEYLKLLLTQNKGKADQEILTKVNQKIAQEGLDQASIQNHVTEMIQIAGQRIFGLHICGWDPRQDAYHLENPPDGLSRHDGHLPPRRVIQSIANEGIKLRDMIDHQHILFTIYQTIGRELFCQLIVILEYDWYKDNRRYNLSSRGELVSQTQEDELAIAARSMRHLITRVLNASRSN